MVAAATTEACCQVVDFPRHSHFSAFALTGFMGFILGPILNRYIGMQGGAEVVASAFAMTALVFGGLSAYVLITRKDIAPSSAASSQASSCCSGPWWPACSSRSAALQLAISAGFVLFLVGLHSVPRPARSFRVVSATTSWRPSACMYRSTTCSSSLLQIFGVGSDDNRGVHAAAPRWCRSAVSRRSRR